MPVVGQQLLIILPLCACISCKARAPCKPLLDAVVLDPEEAQDSSVAFAARTLVISRVALATAELGLLHIGIQAMKALLTNESLALA